MKTNRVIFRTKLLVVCLSVLGLLMFPLTSEVLAVEKMKIGILGAMKVFSGEFIWNAAQITAEEINATGGVNVNGVKHEIELIKIDTNDQASVTDAVSAMERACTTSGAHFLVGGNRTESVLAMQEVMADHKIIYIDPGSSHPNQVNRVKKNYDRYKYYFRTSIMTIPETWGHSIADTDFIGQKLKEELGIDKLRVALVLDKAKYTEDWGAFAEDAFKKMGYDVVGVWKANYAATDLYAEANAIKAKDAHIIYIIMAGPGGAAFVNAWGKLKMPSVLAGTVTESQRLAFWESSGGAASYLASYDSIGRVKMSERTLPFFDKYQERFGDKPGWMSPFTEGAILALKEAVERAGTLDTEAVIKELEKTDLVASNGRLKFHGMDHKWPHQAIRELRTMLSYQWRDGKMIVYFPNATKLNPALLKEVPTLAILEKTKYEGTGEFELPPWVVEYWKSKKE